MTSFDDPGKTWTGSEVSSVFKKSSDINSSPNLTVLEIFILLHINILSEPISNS